MTQTNPCLSAREREIVRLVARGHQNKGIAKALKISHWSVATYLRRAFKKLGVNNRAAMVAVAVELKEPEREMLRLPAKVAP